MAEPSECVSDEDRWRRIDKAKLRISRAKTTRAFRPSQTPSPRLTRDVLSSPKNFACWPKSLIDLLHKYRVVDCGKAALVKVCFKATPVQAPAINETKLKFGWNALFNEEKTMNKLNVAAWIALSTVFATAQAQDKMQNVSALEKTLVESGYRAVGDGLYADQAASGKALIAINAAGHNALADILQNDQAQFLRVAQKDGVSRSEQRILNSLLSNIQSLRQAASGLQSKASQSNYGACYTPNGATLYASATSNGGTSASATAVNALDFGPITPTVNEAEASTEFVTNTDYNIGAAAANASVMQAQSCFAYGYATVTCPGDTWPGVSAYASSNSTRLRCLQ